MFIGGLRTAFAYQSILQTPDNIAFQLISECVCYVLFVFYASFMLYKYR